MQLIKPKILFFDIEATNLSADFGFMLCFGYKWQGDKKPTVVSITDFEQFGKDPTNDRGVVKEAIKIISQSDMIVSHYGTRFDIPYINTRILKHGLPNLPVPMSHFDTWRVARDRLKLHSNRLASVSGFLNLEDKTPLHSEHWVRASAGHKPSIKYVVDHCRQDVVVLEEAYNKLRNLTPNHSHMGLLHGKSKVCGTCTKPKLQRAGTRATSTTLYQRFRCLGCGTWTQKCLKRDIYA